MDKGQKIASVGKLFEKFQHLHKEYGQLWMDETFLHWDWWGSTVLALGPWIFWFFYRKRESTHRLLYAGVTVMLISVAH